MCAHPLYSTREHIHLHVNAFFSDRFVAGVVFMLSLHTSIILVLPFYRMMRYECCEGYEQSGEDQGCTSVKPLKNLLETAEDLGATR